MNLMILSILILITGCMCKHEIYKGDQIWKVVAKSEFGRLKEILSHPDMKIERYGRRDNSCYFYVPKNNIENISRIFRATGISHHVEVQDVTKQLDSEDFNNNRRWKRSINSLHNFDYAAYHPLQQIEQWMDLLATKYDFVKIIEIGESYEGWMLKGLHIAKNPDIEKPIFYMDGATHAREWISSATVIYIINQILTNASYSNILENLDFYFVPVVNVDGYRYTWKSERLWRKTRTPYTEHETGKKCYGADANRNWDVNFRGQGASSKKCSIVYHGPSPESELVIHHLANFIRSEKTKIKALVSFHNYGQQILYPYNYNLTLAAQTEDELNDTAYEMSKAIKRIHGSTYEYGRGSEILYVFSGSTSDWAYEKAGIELSFTIELRDRDGPFYFELPADQIKPTGEEIMGGIEILANTLINKYGSTYRRRSS